MRRITVSLAGLFLFLSSAAANAASYVVNPGVGTLQAAIDVPRVHDEGAGLEIDDRVGEKNLDALRRRGHTVLPKTETYASMNFARPVGVRITPKGLEAGLDAFAAAAAAGH